MHVEDWALRAYHDEELEPARQAAVAGHLEGCEECRTELAALAGRAGRVEARLAGLAPIEPAPRREATWSRLVVRRSEKERYPMLKSIFGKRSAWAGLAAVAALAAAFSFAPVRIWAGQFLGLFRVQQIRVLELNPAQLQALSNDSSLGEQIGQLFSESVTVTTQPGAAKSVPDAQAASESAGFAVRLLSADLGIPQLIVHGASGYEVVVDRQRAQAVIDGAGRQDLQLPASLDGAKIGVDIPADVTAAYGECPDFASTDAGEEGPEGPGFGDRSFRDCVILSQAPSPTVNTPPDVDVKSLAELALQVSGMTAEEARSFSDTVDWTTTLVVPIPRNAASYETISVDGGVGTLIYRQPDDGVPARYMVIWVKGGIIYALSGFGSPSMAASLANSIQ